MVTVFVILTVLAISIHGYKMIRIAITGRVPTNGSSDYAARRLGMKRR